MQKEEELSVGSQRNAELTSSITALERQKDQLQSKLTDHLGLHGLGKNRCAHDAISLAIRLILLVNRVSFRCGRSNGEEAGTDERHGGASQGRDSARPGETQ